METKKETGAPTIGVEVGDQRATLELVQPEKPVEIVWTKERVEVLKRQCCPPDITEDEFFVFLEQCKRTGMDPLLGQADCIGRGGYAKIRDPNSGQIIEKWVEKKVFSPREAGMRARADLFADYRGIASAAVREGDDFKILKGEKKVVHNFNPADPARMKKPVVGAWAQIFREGRSCDVRWIPISERIGTKKDGGANVFWSAKAETMIDKCARAEAYRLEYPNAFAGQFIREEIEDFEEREVNAPPQPKEQTREQHENDGKSRTERTTEKVKEAAKKAEQKPPAPGTQTVDAPKPTPPPKTEQKPPADATPRMSFGPESVKGKAISELSGAEVAAMIDLGQAQLQKHPSASWFKTVEACVDQLRKEQEARLLAASKPEAAEPEREPGEDREEEPPLP